MAIITIDPTTDEPAASYPATPLARLDELVTQAQAAFESWRAASFAERAAPMRRVAALLRERAGAFAELMAREMGKPVREGRAEAAKCASVCEYYAEHAERFLAPEPMISDASASFVTLQPLGVVLAVMPWNFPFWQVFRFVAPALMAGNAALLKHASNVPGCALAIEQALRDAGFPAGLFRALLISSGAVARLIDHPLVRAVTLTGSTPAGRAVAARAGKRLKKTVLELGGSDPYLVLGDADLELAVEACTTSRLLNCGQSCIAAKRFVVEEPIRLAFEQRFVAQMQAKKVGNPLAEDTEIGPMARTDLREELHQQVKRSIELGARCLLGGMIPLGKGAFYPPTVLTDVRPGMPAYEEELFGPVAAIISARDEAHAIAIANDSCFGLGAAVFTADIERGRRIAETALEAGSCFVNAFVRSDPRLPFGGIKESGYGRELSHYGIKEFVNIKTVYVR